MGTSQTRLELLVDVFEKTKQRALVLPTLTPVDLVAAVLREFRELEYLTQVAADYELHRAEDQARLDNQVRLGRQVTDGERLILVEKEAPLPDAALRPSKNIYLREQTTGTVYKLYWQPAVIGRPDKTQGYDGWLTVNLASHKTGLRVSRRHAMVTEQGGQYYIESLSRNPTSIKNQQGETITLDAEKHSLNNGDLICLERSDIVLKFIIREDQVPTNTRVLDKKEQEPAPSETVPVEET